MRRIIREEEPPRPSTRLEHDGRAADRSRRSADTEPAKLTKLVRGELDWIVMKALEKDRNRAVTRRPVPSRADVQRYLNDEPVQACPPSAWYRFRKFARAENAWRSWRAIRCCPTGPRGGATLSRQQRAGPAGPRTRASRPRTSADRPGGPRVAANNSQSDGKLLDECPEDLRGWEWHYLKRLRYSTLRPLRHDSPRSSARRSARTASTWPQPLRPVCCDFGRRKPANFTGSGRLIYRMPIV